MRGRLLVVLLGGCGRFDFAPVPDGADSRSDAPELRACERAWLSGPTFTAPQVVVQGPEGFVAPFLAADQRTLYYESELTGGGDIYVATRPTLDTAFGPAMAVGEVNSTANDSQFTLSADGLEGFLASARGGQNDIWHTTRAITSDPFDAPMLVPEIDTPGDELNPLLSYDGHTLFFSSISRAGGVGGFDIWTATRSSPGAVFSTPTLLTELAFPGNEASASLNATGRVIVFGANLPGSLGSLSLWYATRADVAQPFGAPQLVPMLNTPSTDYTPYLRPDGCELFWTSERDTGLDAIYKADVLP